MDVNILWLGEKTQGFKATFPSYATGLHATKRCSEVPDQPTVHPNNPCMHLAGNPVGTLEVVCPYRSTQAIGGGIGQFQRLLLGIEGHDGDHGAKYFLLVGSASHL